MGLKEKQLVFQLYEKSLIISRNRLNNQNIARVYDYRGVELWQPLHFENTAKGFQSLLRWIKTIVSGQNLPINKNINLAESFANQRECRPPRQIKTKVALEA
ncbi:hypothetical protein [Desulfotruncus alcoholivorax]|uniref:hypothetical protein n=1 Tax=Desulfotruncus alcoholivorax TaxID=265477 RepID=UPI0003F51727|nr:hypothetical protein [Desulfotruncus alcoholivorax]